MSKKQILFTIAVGLIAGVIIIAGVGELAVGIGMWLLKISLEVIVGIAIVNVAANIVLLSSKGIRALRTKKVLDAEFEVA